MKERRGLYETELTALLWTLSSAFCLYMYVTYMFAYTHSSISAQLSVV